MKKKEGKSISRKKRVLEIFICFQIISCVIIVIFLFRNKSIHRVKFTNFINNLEISHQHQLIFENESSFNWYNYEFYELPKRAFTYCHYCNNNTNTISYPLNKPDVVIATAFNIQSDKDLLLFCQNMVSFVYSNFILFISDNEYNQFYESFLYAIDCNIQIINVGTIKDYWKERIDLFKHHCIYTFLNKYQMKYNRVIVIDANEGVFLSNPFIPSFDESKISFAKDCSNSLDENEKKSLSLSERNKIDFHLNPTLFGGSIYTILDFYSIFLSSSLWENNFSDKNILNNQYLNGILNDIPISMQNSLLQSAYNCELPKNSQGHLNTSNIYAIVGFKKSSLIKEWLFDVCHVESAT